MNVNNASEVGSALAEIGIFDWPKASADANATAATAETSIGLIGPGPVSMALGSIGLHVPSGLTAGGTVGAVICVYKRTPGTASATAASGATLGVLNTGGQSLAAFASNGFSVAAGAYVSPGDAITLSIAKTGAGQVVPQGFVAGFGLIN